MRRKGFTLLELIVVIVIIGILAGLAIPNYMKAKERALGKEAIANLKLITAAEKIYRMEMNTYYPAEQDVTDVSQINDNLKISLNEKNWDYYLNGGQDAFGAYAERIGSGGYLDCTYWITNAMDEPVPTSGSNCP